MLPRVLLKNLYEMNMRGRFLLKSLFMGLSVLLSAGVAGAQNFSAGTNIVEWANFGTVNTEVGAAVSRHISVHAAVRYNPWTFRKGNPEDRYEPDPFGETERQFENRKRAVAVGVRYWPWYVFSGWWIYGRAQYMEYNHGGIFHHTAEEGDAIGGGVGFGYTYLLHKHWNIEGGVGVWAGSKKYTVYGCTNCGTFVDQGRKFFFLPDDIFISIVYMF